MEFKEFAKNVADNFSKISNKSKLFRVDISGQDLWDLYLESFKPEDNPVFRDPESTEHNCNLDKNFVRRYGNVVGLDSDNNIITMWDIDLDESDKYYNSVKALVKAIKKSKIVDVFVESYSMLNELPYEKTNKSMATYKLGFVLTHKIYSKEEANKFGVVEPNKSYGFYHFYADLKKDFVDFSISSVNEVMARYRSPKEVFKRAMTEISLGTLNLVKDLITQGSLLNGDAQLNKITSIIKMKEEYDSLKANKDNWCWLKSYGYQYASFRSELIGTLCVDIESGVDLNKVCQDWNIRVDPVNYMKAQKPITQAQINEARKFVEENGYEESFDRRYATIADIDINEIIHTRSTEKLEKTASIFDNLSGVKNATNVVSKFDNIEEISIEKFMKDILPSTTKMEVFVENRMESNLVSLFTSNVVNSKSFLKWNNNFTWTYNGNLAGKSMIKEAVSKSGGKVDGVLRFSISWNEDGKDILDYDAHAEEPTGTHIHWCNYKGNKTPLSGMLDVDMIRPVGLGVENITWTDLNKMKDGEYRFWINNYDSGRNKGFKAEIEFNGQIHQYNYTKEVMGDLDVAVVTLKNGVFSIKHFIDSTTSSKKMWNIDTNEFHEVNLVCLSPNYWGENETGHKHYLFMLKDCLCDKPMRTFHNEMLSSDLLKHRKVMDVLGDTTRIEPSDKQLSGIGFNSTVKDELIVKVTGSFKRTLKIKFK